MQRAGAATAAEIALRCGGGAHLRSGALVYAGPGNNGGDAWVVAAALAATGVRTRVCEPVPAATDDAKAERALALPLVEVVQADEAAVSAGDIYRGEAVVVDGLLGTGSSGPPRGAIGAAVAGLRAIRQRATTVVALDVPTGVDATSGAAHNPVRADITFTYGTLKRGQLMSRGPCGRIVVLDIGLREDAADSSWPTRTVPVAVTGRWVAERLPVIPADAH